MTGSARDLVFMKKGEKGMCLVKSYIKRHNSMAGLLAGNLFHLSVYLTSFSSVSFHLPLTWGSAEDYIIDPLIDFRINEFTIKLIRCSVGTLAETLGVMLMPDCKMVFLNFIFVQTFLHYGQEETSLSLLRLFQPENVWCF